MELERKYNKTVKNDTKKYFLDICNKKIKPNTNTREWLIIKNIILDNKVIEGLMDNNFKVVVKANSNELIQKEYKFSELIKNCKGFVKYICKFSCNDSLTKYIKENSENIGDGLCQETGIKTDYIVMPYFELGSLYNLKLTSDIKYCLKEAISDLLCAAKKYNFIHNDFHADNIMLKKKSEKIKTYIIDFEMSYIYKGKNIEKEIAKIDLRKLFNSRCFIMLDTLEIERFILYIRDPFNETTFDNLYDIYSLIDKLEYL
jgi:serine/threonine protein kinase